MRKLIFLSGKMGSGKTSIAKALKTRLQFDDWDVSVIKFADPLYEMHDFCRGIVMDAGIVARDAPKDGKLLQWIGTEWGRSIDEDVWVKLFQNRVRAFFNIMASLGSEKQAVICDDLRFKNEFNAFPTAIKVRLECGRDTRKARCESWRDNEKHPSETDLDEWRDMFSLTLPTDIWGVDDCVDLIIDTMNGAR